jgi:DNA-binding NarL/FixJ family response regulator
MNRIRIRRSIFAAGGTPDTRRIGDASSIRVLLVDMPRMMRDIIAGVVRAEPDLDLVGEIEAPETLLTRARRMRPDLVIAGATPTLASVTRELLGDYPRLRIIEVEVEDGRGSLYELSPRRRKLGELSPESLVAVAREQS